MTLFGRFSRWSLIGESTSLEINFESLKKLQKPFEFTFYFLLEVKDVMATMWACLLPSLPTAVDGDGLLVFRNQSTNESFSH